VVKYTYVIAHIIDNGDKGKGAVHCIRV
jgi:hypothetical protein